MRVNLYAPHPASRVLVVASGVDTLHLFTRAPLHKDVVERVVRLRGLTESLGEPERVEFAGVELVVQPYKLRKGSALLESDFFALKLAPSATGTEATATIEVRALKLWATGWRRAADTAIEVLRAVCVTGAELEVQVARCDVCLDFQGWKPTPEDRVRFRCQSPNRARYYAKQLRPGWETREVLQRELARIGEVLSKLTEETDTGELVSALERVHRIDGDLFSEFDQAGALTGYTFGRGGAVSSRAYDKTREIRKTRKGFMRAVWRKCDDYREGQAVWRLEFQLMREGLREMEITTPGGWVDLGEWEFLRSRVDAVWAYCSGKWLWHGTRTKDERKHFSKPWRALHEQTIDQGYERPEVTWRTDMQRISLEGAVRPIHAGLAGYLTAGVAQQLEAAGLVAGSAGALPWAELAHQAVESAVRDANRRGVDLSDRAQEKLQLIENRRRHLEKSAKRGRAVAGLTALKEMREPGADG